MSDTKFKKAFDDVAPDMYMQTRILADIKEKRKKQVSLKAVLSGALALALAVGCFGGIQYKNQNTYVDRPFSVMVVDASDDIPISEEISDDTLLFPSICIEYIDKQTEDGNEGTVGTSDSGGFAVTGDDIDNVAYKSKNGSFMYYDILKMEYDIQNQNFYNVIIPVADEDVELVKGYIHSSMMNPEETALKKYMENHDVSKYFNDEANIRDYWVYFGKSCDYLGPDNDSQDYAFFLYNTTNWEEDYFQQTGFEDSADGITVKMYPVSTDNMDEDYKASLKGFVSYMPETALSAYGENPDMNMCDLPEDEITIIVTFKDGKKAKKIVNVSFNDDGYAQFAFK